MGSSYNFRRSLLSGNSTSDSSSGERGLRVGLGVGGWEGERAVGGQLEDLECRDSAISQLIHIRPTAVVDDTFCVNESVVCVCVCACVCVYVSLCVYLVLRLSLCESVHSYATCGHDPAVLQ
jgi:hypothetical protein